MSDDRSQLYPDTFRAPPPDEPRAPAPRWLSGSIINKVLTTWPFLNEEDVEDILHGTFDPHSLPNPVDRIDRPPWVDNTDLYGPDEGE